MAHPPPSSLDAEGPVLPAKAEAVLRAASKVFLAYGFSAATTDMIQCAAGVSKSTVYAHYPNKEALFVAVIERQCALMAQRLSGIAFQRGNLRQTLTALGLVYLETVLEPDALALFRVVAAEAPRFPQLARRFYRAGPQAVSSRATEYLAQAARAGEVDLTITGVDTAAHAFIGLVRNESHLHYLMHPEARASAEQIDQYVTSAVTIFMRAFGTR